MTGSVLARRVALVAVVASAAAVVFEILVIRLFRGIAPLPPVEVLAFHLAAAAVAAAVVLLAARFGPARNPARAGTPEASVAGLTLLLLYATAWGADLVAILQEGLGPWPAAVLGILVLVGPGIVLVRVAAADDADWFGLAAWAAWCAGALAWARNLPAGGSPGLTAFLALSFVGSVLLVLTLRAHLRTVTPRTLVVAFATVLAFAFLQLLAARTWTDRALRPTAQAPADGPHILLVVLDTLRKDVFDDILAGAPEGRALAEALGPVVWFEQNVTVGPSTPPTMTTVLSGLLPNRHGIDGRESPNWLLRIDDELPLLAERLAGLGYQTIAGVTNSTLGQSIGLERGWNLFDGLRPTRESFLATWTSLRGSAQRPFMLAGPAREATVHLLRRLHRADHPTFLWFHLMDTHKPVSDHRSSFAEDGPDDLARYRAAARYQARELALAIAQFREFLPAEDTVTIVMADHGEMLASDGHTAPGYDQFGPRGFPEDPPDSGHAHNYFESVIHGILGIQLPGARARGHRNASLVSQTDLLPTLLDQLGLEWPSALPGCSLTPVLLDPGADLSCRDVVVSSANDYGPRHKALRTGNLKVMVPDDPDAFAPLLFDLAVDPLETENLAPTRPEELAAARQLLAAFAAEAEGATPGASELSEESIRRLRALGYVQ